MECPKCGSTSGFKKLEMEDGGSGCLMLLLGGIIPYLIFSSNREGKSVCTRCGYAFTPPSSSPSRTAYLGIAIGGVILFTMLVAWFLMNFR